MESIEQLFDTADFPPRWSCGDWSALHGWIHICSDIGIWSAYFAIPAVLGYFILKRKDLPFRGVFVLFGGFILLCGSTHLMEAIIFWWPAYRLAGLIKLITAIVSWTTVFALFREAPAVIAMRSPEELEREIAARTLAEEGLHRANAELERRVDERTTELTEAVTTLRNERELLRITLDNNKRVEAELRDARSRLEATLTAAEIGTCVYHVASNSVRADENFARMYGLTPVEAAGGPLEMYKRRIHPDDWDRLAEVVGRAAESGNTYECEHRIVPRDGGMRWVVARGRVERDAAGQAVSLPGVVVDITERKRVEDELRDERERLAFALEAADLAQWEFNLLDNSTYRTPRYDQIFGYDPLQPAWTYERFLEHVAPDDRASVESRFQETISTGTVLDVECRIQRADGAQRWIWSKARTKRDEPGAPVSLVGVVMDITARKRADEELKRLAAELSEADRRKNEFLATLAHELRNPLAPIRNGLQLMKLGTNDPAKLESIRGMMDRQLTQLVRLVDDLMDVSRISRGKIDLHKERIDVAKVLTSAIETARPQLERMGQELTINLPDRPIFLDGDLIRLAQVFANLLNNAAKYSERGDRIQLLVEVAGGEVVVTVSDPGIGIAADQLQRIFEMFAQVDRSIERSHGGLGIGLTLVKRLVEMHGGTVFAKSDGLGKGSAFIVRLPLTIETTTHPEAGGQSTVARSAHRILIVDDNVDGADSLSMMLRILGNDTRTAYDGRQGLDLAREFRPDVVLLDIGLPVLNGYEVCRHIREQHLCDNALLIALTGWGQDEDRGRSREAGFDYHMIKPVTSDELMKLLAGFRGKPSSKALRLGEFQSASKTAVTEIEKPGNTGDKAESPRR